MSEPMEMNCSELARVAPELALGVLTGRERADAVAHLAACDGCREYVRQMIETHEGLLALLPPAEPAAGFEMRVLNRLGLPDSGPRRTGLTLSGLTVPGEPLPGTTLPGTTLPGLGLPVQGGPHGTVPPGTVPPGTGPRGTGPGRRGLGRSADPVTPPGRRPQGRRAISRRRQGASRSRRLLVAGALVLSVAGAALSGWGLGMGMGTAARPGPPPPGYSQAIPLVSAPLLTGSHQNVGQFFYYKGNPEWLYMEVDLPAGDGMVTCQLKNADGTVTTVGSFPLTHGTGHWSAPDPDPDSGNPDQVRGAQLVGPNGAILAIASL